MRKHHIENVLIYDSNCRKLTHDVVRHIILPMCMEELSVQMIINKYTGKLHSIDGVIEMCQYEGLLYKIKTMSSDEFYTNSISPKNFIITDIYGWSVPNSTMIGIYVDTPGVYFANYNSPTSVITKYDVFVTQPTLKWTNYTVLFADKDKFDPIKIVLIFKENC